MSVGHVAESSLFFDSSFQPDTCMYIYYTLLYKELLTYFTRYEYLHLHDWNVCSHVIKTLTSILTISHKLT